VIDDEDPEIVAPRAFGAVKRIDAIFDIEREINGRSIDERSRRAPRAGRAARVARRLAMSIPNSGAEDVLGLCSFCLGRIGRIVWLAVHRFRESLSLRIKGGASTKGHVHFETETEKHLTLANLLTDLPSGVVIFLHPVSTRKIDPVPGVEQGHQGAICHFRKLHRFRRGARRRPGVFGARKRLESSWSLPYSRSLSLFYSILAASSLVGSRPFGVS
jgi:hypothetical protein